MNKNKFFALLLSGLMAVTCLVQPVFATAGSTETAVPTESAAVEETPAVSSSIPAVVEIGTGINGLTRTSSILTGEDGFPSFDTLDCRAALLVDVNSRTVLYDQDGDSQMLFADTVKVMTALLTLDAIDQGELSLSTTVTITETMLTGVSSPDLQVGEEVTVEELLYLLMLTSRDEAGYALSNTVAGSTELFVQQMNTRAAQLGCTNTHFTSPVSSTSSDQYTTCYDLYLITEAAMERSVFQDIVSVGSYTMPETNLSDSRFYYNSNLLVTDRTSTNYNYTYATGVKVGSTYESGACMVASAEYNGRTLIAILIGTTDSIDELGNVIRPGYDMAASLFRYGFVQFYSVQVAEANEFVSQVDVTMGKDSDYVLLATANDVTIDLVSGLSVEDFNRELVLPDSIQAPVSAGDVVGTMNFSYQGYIYASVDLIAMTDIELSVQEQTWAVVSTVLSNPAVRVAIVLAIVLVLALVVIIMTKLLTKRRYEQRRARRQARQKQKQKQK